MNEISKLRKTSRAIRSNYKLNLDVPTINQDGNGVSCNCKVCQYH